MTVQPTQVVQQGKKSGSKIGGLLGLIGGIGATIATGGLAGPLTLPAAASALGMVSGGASLGQTVGGLAKPGQEAQSAAGVAVDPDGGAMTRRLKSGEAQAHLAQLRDSAMATQQLPPEERGQYLEPIFKAAGLVKNQMGA